MKLRYKIGLVLSILGAVFIWGRCSKTIPLTGPKTTTVLPKDEKEQVIVDPVHHKLIITTPKGQTIQMLPDRESVFDVKTDGTVKVTAQQLGFETRPFIGLGFGSGLRGYVGADLWYFKKLDLGLAFVTPKLTNPEFTDTRAGLFVSYNVYDNSRLSVGIDTSKTLHVLVSIRI